MTSKYDEKVFEFLTETEENFSAACEISENFPKIKDRLVEEFWEEVKGELKRKVEEGKKGWKIEKDYTKNKWSKLGFCFADGDIRVIFERLSGSEGYNLCYGLWINERKKERFEEKIRQYTEEIKNIRKNLEDDREITDNKWYLAVCENTGYDFQTRGTLEQMETLKRILPHNRSEFANELANLLFEFTEEIYEPVILGFEKTSL